MENNKLKAILAVLSFFGSLIFGLLGFWAVPIGQISPSVLIYIAEMLLFCCFLLGISTENSALLKEVAELVKEFKHK